MIPVTAARDRGMGMSGVDADDCWLPLAVILLPSFCAADVYNIVLESKRDL